MKRLFAIIILCVISFSLVGKEKPEFWPDGSKIGKWFRSEPRVPKGKQFVITDFGARPDSTILQTASIQKAIDAAAVKGGVVVIPEGTWLSGALFFKPGTHLYLSKGAVLKGSTDTNDFPDVPVHIEGVLQPYAAALVNACSCDGFSISGEGTLDGNGLPYWQAFWARRKENPKCTNLEVRRPRMVSISNSSNISIVGVKLRNSAFWNIHLYKCSKVLVSGVSVYAPIKPVKAPSSDGIDLDACIDVHICSSSFATGDDLIALKGGKGPWADTDPDNGVNANVLVEDCEFGHGPGVLVFGSECVGARNVILRNSKVSGTDRLLWLKMRPDTPQVYSDILIEGVEGYVRNVIYVKPWTQFFDLKGREDIPKSYARNITIRDCKLTCKRRRNIEEAPDQYEIEGLVIKGNKFKWRYNKKEENVKPYTLPDVLSFADGCKVENPGQWPSRKAEVLELFQKEMYGQMPPAGQVFLEAKGEEEIFGGAGLRRNVRMTFREDGSGPHIDWMILYPAGSNAPVPAVLMMNYYGNQAILDDMSGRNSRSVFPLDTILARGYAYVTACYEDVSPDPEEVEDPDEQLAVARTGVYELWDKDITTGSLMAWAWALCRGMDMLGKDSRIDASKVLLTGSSRLGKAALLAAAFDERFAVVCLNQTGGGGVPLSKRNFGENVGTEIDSYCYWWCKAFRKWAGKENKMPFDQHMILSCIAPRPLLVEGFNNPWFDARGEFLALKAASPVWELLGAEGLPDVEFPHSYETKAIGRSLGYVKRKGPHGFSYEDWRWMLDFASLSP